ncbi:hypothetical protein CN141_33165, partial [Sinorhizobium meliloti]
LKPGTTSSTASSTTKKSSLASRRNLRGNNRPVTDDVRSRFDLCPPGMWEVGAGKCRRSALGSGN